MAKHLELAFEDGICAHLADAGWLYEPDAASRYERALALFPEDLVAWVQATQPKAWEVLEKNHGAQAEATLQKRVRQQLDQQGTLEVLRHGVDLLGLKVPLKLAEFKPAMAINAEILARYQANRLRVVRQVRYSLHHENCLDLVLFLNGIPVATAELKSDFTQSVEDAVDQYRRDRLPQSKGKAAEPLLEFPRGALVHFAVSQSKVRMTTRLAGPATVFLPFDQGDRGGAGNTPREDGYPTAYLWKEVWSPERWLEILGRYLVSRRDKKGKVEQVLFPRYHQLDATRKLVAEVRADGPGTRYLIQHSAGSGKTNSIAWTAHLLADMHDASDRKVFDSVLVISDRNVIDAQLQEALFAFERTKGLVASVTGEGSSKSSELAQALSGGKKIVVCTIQTFPFALAEVRKLAATEGKRFAVIADEAHSSQTGEAASKLKAVLTPEELESLDDGGEITVEDVLAAQMAARADDRGITFVAFTATPKNKTLELFGTRPDPTRPPAPDNVPVPFHVYSMRQAIEEGFILDVLRNYTAYQVAYSLALEGHELDDRTVERRAAMKRLKGWVQLHGHNIAQKVGIIVEHYRRHVAPLLDGKAKAMVVVSSRLEAVRWKQAIDAYIREKGYAIGTLVAFSGQVDDHENGQTGLSEHSALLNPDLAGRDIREAFKGGGYHLLLVANKFQTGFDQPLLCGMYIDKKLAGIQAVQTLSRLNRAHPGKDTTYVLDFRNQPEEVLEAFRTYYETATLESTTDPNLVFNTKQKLDALGHYDDHEVDRVVRAELDPRATQADLVAAIKPVQDRLDRLFKQAQQEQRSAAARGDTRGEKEAKDQIEALKLFRADMGGYVRLYTFLSQIYDYQQTAVEARAIFYKRLVPLLEFSWERESVDLSTVQLVRYRLQDRGQAEMVIAKGEALKPITATGSGSVQDKQRAQLRDLIETLNALFEGELTDEDTLIYVDQVLRTKMLASPTLRAQARSNTAAQFEVSTDLPATLKDAIITAMDAHTKMSTQALNDSKVFDGILRFLLKTGLFEALREEQVAV